MITIVDTEVPKGIVFPHDLDPEKFLKVMSEAGFVHRFEEVDY